MADVSLHTHALTHLQPTFRCSTTTRILRLEWSQWRLTLCLQVRDWLVYERLSLPDCGTRTVYAQHAHMCLHTRALTLSRTHKTQPLTTNPGLVISPSQMTAAGGSDATRTYANSNADTNTNSNSSNVSYHASESGSEQGLVLTYPEPVVVERTAVVTEVDEAGYLRMPPARPPKATKPRASTGVYTGGGAGVGGGTGASSASGGKGRAPPPPTKPRSSTTTGVSGGVGERGERGEGGEVVADCSRGRASTGAAKPRPPRPTRPSREIKPSVLHTASSVADSCLWESGAQDGGGGGVCAPPARPPKANKPKV